MKILLIDNYDSFTFNLYHYLSSLKCNVEVYRNNKITIDQIKRKKFDKIVISPGPGTPEDRRYFGVCKDVIQKLGPTLPILGICLGHQILALALGGKTKKMKLGHRGANHPVKNLVHDKVEITSQNHGFVVVEETLPKKIEVTHKSLFDNTIEGIKLKNKPVFSVQYHPESNPGPQDSVYLFQEFINNMKKNAKKKRY